MLESNAYWYLHILAYFKFSTKERSLYHASGPKEAHHLQCCKYCYHVNQSFMHERWKQAGKLYLVLLVWPLHSLYLQTLWQALRSSPRDIFGSVPQRNNFWLPSVRSFRVSVGVSLLPHLPPVRLRRSQYRYLQIKKKLTNILNSHHIQTGIHLLELAHYGLNIVCINMATCKIEKLATFNG